MQLEFHQLDRRWEHLRVRHPARQRRLLASLAEVGQQTPIVVVAAEGQADRRRSIVFVYSGLKPVKRIIKGAFITLEASAQDRRKEPFPWIAKNTSVWMSIKQPSRWRSETQRESW